MLYKAECESVAENRQKIMCIDKQTNCIIIYSTRLTLINYFQ